MRETNRPTARPKSTWVYAADESLGAFVTILKPPPVMFGWSANRLTPSRRRKRRLVAEPLEARAMLAGNPLGVTPTDTGEFLLGRVVVTPVLFDSNGDLDPSTENWSPSEIQDFLTKVEEGTHWWTETLAGITDRHQLEFVIDPTFATTPFATKYEPIDRNSEGFLLYGRDFLDAQGLQGVPAFQEAIYQFNDAQRQKLDADWAFTIFVADASNEPDGTFASGGAFSGAFAYAGGQFIVMPSTRPASTITHETGHIFWARDEYAGGSSWTDLRGYYNTQNRNAADNSTPGFVQEISIMRGGGPLQEAYLSHTSPASTLAMLGWQDSDGDGVFDLADVPLNLQAVGTYDSISSTYRLTGSASAVPLVNRNSAGNQSDITLNRISRIEYSIDDGPWQTAASPNTQIVDSFDLSVSTGAFDSIRWRAIDAVTGMTSDVLVGTPTTPILSSASIVGFAYLDSDRDGIRDGSEALLAGVKLHLTLADGSPLLGGSIAASDFGDVPISDTAALSLSAKSSTSNLAVYSFASAALDGQRVFQGFDSTQSRFTDAWSAQLAFVADFDSPIGQSELTVWGLSSTSYARVEAYDAGGELIGRSTTGAILKGASATLRIADPNGRIASVKVFGHAGTRIAISELKYGATTTLVTDASGTYRIPNLPAGSYQLSLETENVTQMAENLSITIDVTTTTLVLDSIAIHRVDSPFYNKSLAEDVNGDGVITAADALNVINDLNVNESRVISHGEVPTLLVDVNNDGRVTALDALTVVNWLNINDSGSGQASSEQFTSSEMTTDASTGTARDENPPTSGLLADSFNRDIVLSGWGDSADYGLEAESNTNPAPDSQSRRLVNDKRAASETARVAIGSRRLNADTIEEIDDSPLNETVAEPNQSEISLSNFFSSIGKRRNFLT